MKGGPALLGLLAVVSSIPASAQCRSLTQVCYCFEPAAVGVGVTEAVSGARATVRIESASAGFDAGEVLELPRLHEDGAGARWLLLDTDRRLISDAGTVNCKLGYPENTAMQVETVTAAVLNGQCDDLLHQAGFVEPPCHDTGPRCAVAPGAPLLLVGLWWAASRLRKRASNR